MTDGNGRSALDRAGQTKKQGAAFKKESGALPCAGQKENPQPKLRVCGGELGTRTPDPLRVMQVL